MSVKWEGIIEKYQSEKGLEGWDCSVSTSFSHPLLRFLFLSFFLFFSPLLSFATWRFGLVKQKISASALCWCQDMKYILMVSSTHTSDSNFTTQSCSPHPYPKLPICSSSKGNKQKQIWGFSATCINLAIYLNLCHFVFAPFSSSIAQILSGYWTEL